MEEKNEEETITQNPFAGFNASLMNDEDIIKFWIQPHILFGKQAYGIDLTGSIPVVLMGGRGTGKTMLLRFMSNDVQIKNHISRNRDVKKFLKKAKYIGVYYRFDGTSMASFSNRYVSEVAWETLFKHYFELIIGQKYIMMLFNLKKEECIVLNPEQEQKLVVQLLNIIDPNTKIEVNENSCLEHIFNLIQKKINNVFEFVNNSALSKNVQFEDYILNSGDLIFGMPTIIQNFIQEIQGKNIIILLDEYENLRELQQKIINTLIKHTRLPVSFRIGTRINGFKTFDTLNQGEFLMVDADYRIIQFEDILLAKDKEFRKLLKKIARRKLELIPSFKNSNIIDINNILGHINPEEEAMIVVFGKIMEKQEIEKYSIDKYILEAKHINEIIKIVKKNNPKQSELILRQIIYPQNPLIEMLNLLLLKRDYKIEEVIKLFKTYTIGKKTNIDFKKYNDLYNKNKLGLLYQLISLNKPKQKLYAGFDVFCMLSSGIMRNFLELCYQCFNTALFSETDELFGKGRISFSAQTEGAKIRSTRVYEDTIDRIPEYGNEIKSLVRSLGAIYSAWQMDARLSEPELTYFCVDKTSLSEEARKVLDSAVRWSALQQKKSMKGKSPGEPLLDVYALNRILAPYFEISYRLRGRIGRFTKNDIESMMFGSDSEKQRVVTKLGREPVFEEKITLIDFLVRGDRSED